ncbi:MAG: hypothetical protein LBQ20_11800 [Rhodanobacter sp.]|jgi:hypothetical protein|nr:hypothetical protein [Rhodanobacter sp.]
MSRRREKMKGRRETGGFLAMPHSVMDSPNFKALSGSAVKVLLTIARQYNGRNNGDLGASFTVMRPCGIRSPVTLHHAIRELKHYGMIELTRQGGRCGEPSLYALTWRVIDECKGKLDVADTAMPSRLWRQECEPFARTKKIKKGCTVSVSHRYINCISDAQKAA